MTRLRPPRELERLAALRDLAILDTEPEQQFDAVCRHACELFRVPMSYIAFIDEGRQWLKAACGMSLSSVPRWGTICSNTILLERLLLIKDASTDARFASNPYVVGPPYISFYAGAPLTVAPGLRVGTLCLLDTVPREFAPAQMEALQSLAEEVVSLLQARAAAREKAA